MAERLILIAEMLVLQDLFHSTRNSFLFFLPLVNEKLFFDGTRGHFLSVGTGLPLPGTHENFQCHSQ